MFKKMLLGLILFIAGCTININVDPVAGKKSPVWDPDDAFKSIAVISVSSLMGEGGLNGTGFAIDENHLLTAGHVCISIAQLQEQKLISDNIRLGFYAPDGKRVVEAGGAEIVEIDETTDLCVLRRIDHGLVPVKFVKDYFAEVQNHSKAFIVGAPLGIYITHSEGEVVDSYISLDLKMRNKLVIDAAGTNGNSGSPVFNENGEVIGVMIAGAATYDHLSICTPSFIAQKFLGFLKLK